MTYYLYKNKGYKYFLAKQDRVINQNSSDSRTDTKQRKFIDNKQGILDIGNRSKCDYGCLHINKSSYIEEEGLKIPIEYKITATMTIIRIAQPQVIMYSNADWDLLGFNENNLLLSESLENDLNDILFV